MGKEDFKEFVDNIANYVASKNFKFEGPGGLLSNIIKKEIIFLIFLTIVYLITLGVKQRSRTLYKYLVTLTIAGITIYTYYVSTIFDESIKNGTATQEIIKGLPPVCICIIIKLFKLIPPLKLAYYSLPVLMIAYSVYYHNLLSSSKSKSKSKSSKGRSRTQSHSHSHSHQKDKKKDLKGFIRVSLSLFTDFIHSFNLFYAYAVLVLLIFINNNYDYTINSINNGNNTFGKVLRFLDIPFLTANNKA
ncbi:hypothetical protein LY90DRAFT_696672 [Neocallimastix californiae]|uniref:Uncharacterized protein n=1 Tax=Neocallimastix californiae TaxID=1754190 RepID=A0A1Y2FVD1_9FUNG|nr:hypothetical protein LY90DRAFT_696672 [Neocallimastix californiae]|eukprot:ORY87264.1 hypothetical protein LY90DRAFT_696672 [Neocallimastix californiae]